MIERMARHFAMILVLMAAPGCNEGEERNSRPTSHREIVEKFNSEPYIDPTIYGVPQALSGTTLKFDRIYLGYFRASEGGWNGNIYHNKEEGGGFRVRLEHIEIPRNCKYADGTAWDCGEAARLALQGMIKNEDRDRSLMLEKPIPLWTDAKEIALRTLLGGPIVVCVISEYDFKHPNGELIANCAPERTGLDLNDWLVRRGLAIAKSNEHVRYAEAAKKAKLGIWQGSFEIP